MRVKPNNPKLQVGHPLAKKLVFASLLDRHATDLSVYKNHGAVVGCADTVNEFGRGLDWDGDNDVITFPAGTHLDVSMLTMFVLVRGLLTQFDLILGKPHAATHTDPYYKYSIVAANGAPGFEARVSGRSQTFLDSPVDDQWYSVCVTFDEVRLKAYVDGILVSDTGSGGATLDASTQPLRMGNNASEGEDFDGQVACAMIWDRILTPSEIKSLYIDPFEVVRPVRRLPPVAASGITVGTVSLTLTPTNVTVGKGVQVGSASLSLTPTNVVVGKGVQAGTETLTLTPTNVTVGKGVQVGTVSLTLTPTVVTVGGIQVSTVSLSLTPTNVLVGKGIQVGTKTLTLTPTNVTISTGISARKFRVDIDMQGNIIDDAAAFYFGPQDDNDTWRFIPSGSNLVVQRREAGVYVTKSTFTP